MIRIQKKGPHTDMDFFYTTSSIVCYLVHNITCNERRFTVKPVNKSHLREKQKMTFKVWPLFSKWSLFRGGLTILLLKRELSYNIYYFRDQEHVSFEIYHSLPYISLPMLTLKNLLLMKTATTILEPCFWLLHVLVCKTLYHMYNV